MAFADTQRLVVKLDLEGNLQAKLGSAARAIQGFDRATSRTQRSFSQFGRNLERGVVVGTAAVVGGLTAVVKAAADYESAFAGVRKTVTATEPELQALSQQFRELSKQIPISAADLARLGEAGGALGVPTKDLKEFVRVTALLGVTTNLTADEAANSLGVLGNVLHLTGQQYSQFASSLVALGNAGASTEADIVAIAERAGAAGKLIGVSTDQILGFSSAVASLGIEAEAGGTAIQKFFIDSAKFVAAGGKDLAEMAKIAGVSGKAFQKAFREDAGGALREFLAGLGKLSQAKQLKVLEDLGFTDARITRTLLGLANNTKLVADQMGVANQAFKDNTALTKEAEQRFNTFDSQLQITKSTLTDMAITIGSKLLPKITPLLKRLNEFVGKNQAGIEKFADQLAQGFEKFADALGKVDWKPFIDGLKLSGDIAKTVINAFRSLPEDLQKLVIAGFALNKVTGGLGTSIIKDLGAALIGNLAQRGATPANPLFVVDVAGGLGGVGAGAAAAGGVGLGAAATAVAVPVILIGGAAVSLNAIADYAAQNNQLAAKGLSFDEITAVKFYNGTQAWQQDALKHLGRQPTKADFESGMAKLGYSIDRSLDKPSNVTGFGGLAGKLKDDIDEVAHLQKGALDFLRDQFHQMLAHLSGAKTAAAIKAAIKEVELNVFKRGKGGISGAEQTIAALKTALRNTHDPKLAAAIRAELRHVEKQLNYRHIVAAQLKKADQIFRSSESTKRKIEELKAVQRSLNAKDLAAQKRVQEKIDALKRSELYAQRATTQAIKDKDLAVTVNTTVQTKTIINARDVAANQKTISKYFAVAT